MGLSRWDFKEIPAPKEKSREKRSPGHGVTPVSPASGTETPSDFCASLDTSCGRSVREQSRDFRSSLWCWEGSAGHCREGGMHGAGAGTGAPGGHKQQMRGTAGSGEESEGAMGCPRAEGQCGAAAPAPGTAARDALGCVQPCPALRSTQTLGHCCVTACPKLVSPGPSLGAHPSSGVKDSSLARALLVLL